MTDTPTHAQQRAAWYREMAERHGVEAHSYVRFALSEWVSGGGDVVALRAAEAFHYGNLALDLEQAQGEHVTFAVYPKDGYLTGQPGNPRVIPGLDIGICNAGDKTVLVNVVVVEPRLASQSTPAEAFSSSSVKKPA